MTDSPVKSFDLWPNNDRSGASSLYPFLTVRAERDRIEITQTDPRQVVRLTPWMADWLIDALLQIRPNFHNQLATTES